MFPSERASEKNSESLLLFLLHGTEFPVVFFSAEWFGTEFQVFASIVVPRKGIPSCFLFRGKVQNRITRVCFYFCSLVQNSEHFSPLQNGSERNSEFSVPRNSRNSARTNQLLHLFRLHGIIFFCQKWPTLPLCPTESNVHDF
jgi:hypothetical protein